MDGVLLVQSFCDSNKSQRVVFLIKTLVGVFTSFLMFLGLMVVVAPTASACPRDIVFAVGGFNDPGAGGFAAHGNNVVAYSGNLNAIEEGVSALKRDVDAFRANCGGSKVILTGHSQGASIVHVYLSRFGHEIRHNAHAVLFSDPKRPGGESDGLFALGGAPIAGTDNNYGGVRTVQVCHLDDIICNRAAPSGWMGYVNGNHGRYNFDARAYSNQIGEVLYW